MQEAQKQRIVILGASGFTSNNFFKKNHQFFHYDHEKDDIYEILESLKPNVVISSLRGSFATQILAHRHIIEYVRDNNCRIIYLSSANVFDGYSKFPSYENDKTLSESVYGRFKIKIENAIMRLQKYKWTILRLPMVFGSGSQRIE